MTTTKTTAKKATTVNGQPLVISYLRFSTPDQAQGDSARRQTSGAEAWAEKHGYTLSQRLSDLGISAYRGRNAKEGALAQFLKLVDEGRIPKGTILIVEELDRLSRQAPEKSVQFFLGIIDKGITVVTLADGFVYEKNKLDMTKLIMSVMRLCLANMESAKKAERVAAAWAEKRKHAATTPMSKRIPAWLKLEGGKFSVDKGRAAIVKMMFDMVLKGHGIMSITRAANEKLGGKRFARLNRFNKSYVEKILKSRAVIGEFQPMRLVYEGNVKTRVVAGETLVNYYPSIIDEKTFMAVQSLRAARRVAGGRQSKFINLFSGMIKDGEGYNYQINDKGSGKRYVSAKFCNYSVAERSKYMSFPVLPFEQAMIMRLFQGDVEPERQKDTEAIRGKLLAVEAKIAKVEADALESESMEAVVGLLRKLNDQKRELQTELEAEAARGITKKPTIDDFGDLLARNAKGELTYEERLMLRQYFQGIIKEIRLGGIREGVSVLYSAIIILHDEREIELTFKATYRRVAKRDSKGHIAKGKQQSEWEVLALVDDEWKAEGNSVADAIR